MNPAIGVSVLMTTYNQADCVVDALESVLAQDTSFDVEILVHDDASNDGTVDILRAYERDHPGRIRLFLEETNRFVEYASRGYFSCLLAPEAHGTYVALLEGDDYWCDPHKLERQYAYMEAHPNCSECIHRARRVDASSGETIDLMGMGEDVRDLDADDVIASWNVPTASRFIRRSLLPAYASDWVFDKPAGDFPLAVYLASCGYTHHDPMVASVYRFRRPGSYSATTLAGYHSAENALRWLVMLDEIDARTSGAHHGAIKTHVDAYADVVHRWIAGEEARREEAVRLETEQAEALQAERDQTEKTAGRRLRHRILRALRR